MPAFIPSPPVSVFSLGPLTIHIYSLCLIAAIVLAWVWAGKRAESRGMDPDTYFNLAFTAVVSGIIGARIYHVLTEHDRYFNAEHWVNIFKVWNGGIGIIGAITGGALGVWAFCRIKKLNVPAVLDVFAPALPAAQAVGRLGNWVNQEVFGEPTELPWGLEIDRVHRPAGYEEFATFHPTFIYEGLWNVLGVGVLLLLERKLKFGKGKLFSAYVMWYTFGRFFIELIRIDPVNAPAGMRINNWATALIFVAAAVLLQVQLLKFPGSDAHPFAVVGDGDSAGAPETADDEAKEHELKRPMRDQWQASIRKIATDRAVAAIGNNSADD
ncbi:MAG: prolipoprotein diacylglyceryl transferase [Propionibacteriaceae bacterium]|jgi:prolipoprotein diacylglyceryl transferase|nr:prolipoprotein diacylglyceryl transferase [Propionibacteriaceae bacterium]